MATQAGAQRDIDAIKERSIKLALQQSVAAMDATAGASFAESEIDFGSSPSYEASSTVTNSLVTSSSIIVIGQSGNAATGGKVDDPLWDTIAYSAEPGTGQFTVRAVAIPGPVKGKRKFAYAVY